MHAQKFSHIFAKNVVAQPIWSFTSLQRGAKNKIRITWNIKVKFTLTMFNNIYII